MSKWAVIVVGVLVIVVMLSVTIAISGLYGGNPAVTKPFAFNLSTNPNNGTVLQAQNLTLNISATYFEGKPETVTLSASGGPNGTLYQFSNQTGTPINKLPFSNFLTVTVPNSSASEIYPITISATTGNFTCQNTFNLTIINSQIQVTGIVTGTHVDIAGRPSEDIYPTDIEFKSTSTNQTYSAKVHLPLDAKGMPMKTGNYSIILPNQQTYRVWCYFFSYPHFIPVPRVGLNEAGDGYLTVSCGVGVNSTVANFTG